MIGKTLGNFECTALLGKGGMGEVYKARDQKLGRDVAIKVLPEEFAKDAERVARFQREAKLLASLNHPNIASIYDLEEFEEKHFLVLELIEGDTLADRLMRGAIPAEESLKLALQIAEALQAAHEKGVIHRDLKPANIKVTPDGKVKVLDFGLAKAYAGDQEDMNLSNSPTLSAAATQQGIILGTAAYMSPEQAKGKPLDKATDIWAFGCVLYEMLTGQAAFQGEDVTEILASVVKASVNLNALPANIHPRIREILTRCLQKDQKRRYSRTADVQYEMEQVLADPGGIFVRPVTTAKPKKKLRLGLSWVVPAVILSIIAGALAVWYLKPSESHRIVRFEYELPENQQFNDLDTSHLSISPDGSQFVYSTKKGLYLRSLDQQMAKLIPGTDENSRQPLFSPDGEWICYFCESDSKLKKIALSGGAPITLCSSSEPRHPSWDFDDSIVYAQSQGIMRISPNGGTPELLVESEGSAFGEPQILPDGKTVLFAVNSGENKTIAVQSLESGERKELFPGDNPRYLPTGHIVYGLGNNLFAIPFDLGSLDVMSGPISMVEGVLHTGVHSQYAVSGTGTLIYTPGGSVADAESRGTLVWVDREGKEKPLKVEPNSYGIPKISPDGIRIALSFVEDGNEDIRIYDLVRETMTRLTFHEANDLLPLWTPDGQRIIFCSERAGMQRIFWKVADGTGKVEQIASDPNGDVWPWSLSNDGKTLLYGQYDYEVRGPYNIGMLSMEGDRTPKLLLHESHDEQAPQISPDGRWLAYQSDESGQFEVFVRTFPDVDSGGKWQVSANGGEIPLWSPDGRELYYHSPEAIMAVSIETEPSFKLGTPKVLFPDEYGYQWDIHPDGKRFLMLKPAEIPDEESKADEPRRINVVLNWFEELKQRAPAD